MKQLKLSEKIRSKIYQGQAYEIIHALYQHGDWETLDELRAMDDSVVNNYLDIIERMRDEEYRARDCIRSVH